MEINIYVSPMTSKSTGDQRSESMLKFIKTTKFVCEIFPFINLNTYTTYT